MKVYISTSYWYLNPVKEALELISKSLNIEIVETNYFDIGKPISNQIIDTIAKSDVVIADISNENPSVYFEIGVAHSMQKAVIVVSQLDNINKLPIFNSRFYQYGINPEEIKNLSFRLEQVLSSPWEMSQIKLISQEKTFLNFTERETDNRLDQILNSTGVVRYYELESWIHDLLQGIPGFEVSYNERRNGKEYDFIVWNSNEAIELRSLGNPIPVEVKASKNIEISAINSVIDKADSQGFKSIILVTTGALSQKNKQFLRNVKAQLGVAVIVIDGDDLKSISSSEDLFKTIITSYRKFLIY